MGHVKRDAMAPFHSAPPMGVPHVELRRERIGDERVREHRAQPVPGGDRARRDQRRPDRQQDEHAEEPQGDREGHPDPVSERTERGDAGTWPGGPRRTCEAVRTRAPPGTGERSGFADQEVLPPEWDIGQPVAAESSLRGCGASGDEWRAGCGTRARQSTASPPPPSPRYRPVEPDVATRSTTPARPCVNARPIRCATLSELSAAGTKCGGIAWWQGRLFGATAAISVALGA